MRHAAAGRTLVELLVVVALLAAIAGVATQNASAHDAHALDAAVEEVAGALRFARIEAMRTRTSHGVDLSADASTGERHIRVFRVDATVPPVAVFDVRHPVSKAAFDLRLSLHPGTTGAALTEAAFHYSAAGVVETREWIAFDATGKPQYYPDPVTYTPYENATLVNRVVLRRASYTRRLLVDPVHGRVRTD